MRRRRQRILTKKDRLEERESVRKAWKGNEEKKACDEDRKKKRRLSGRMRGQVGGDDHKKDTGVLACPWRRIADMKKID